MNQKVQAIILAAGNGSRYTTNRNKLLEKICGQHLIVYPIKLLQRLSLPILVVVGHQKEHIQKTISESIGDSVRFIEQTQIGSTKNAVMTTLDALFSETVLIMHGDLPLVTPELINKLYDAYQQSHADLSFVFAHNSDPSLTGYDRYIPDQSAQPQDHAPCCVLGGIYLIKRTFLESALVQVSENNAECSLSELIIIAKQQNKNVQPVAASFDEIHGVNTMHDAWIVEQIKRAEIIRHWMSNGVHFSLAQNVHIDLDASIGADTIIGCGVHIRGKTVIGSHVKVHEFSLIENSIIGNETTIYPHTIIKDSCIGDSAKIGPFAHIKEQSSLGTGTVIGNFVEIKKSMIGENTKAKHLTYLGDAQVGSNVNIGAGTITCNHNGVTKNKTSIEDGAYVGAHNTLIAPITIGSKSFTAAGSVLTHDVPDNALALGRARQVNKEGYAQKMREQNKPEDPQNSAAAFVGAVKTINDTPRSSTND